MQRTLCAEPHIVADGGQAVYVGTDYALPLNPTPDRDAAIVHEDDDCIIEWEWISGLTFAHCVIKRPWTPSVARRALPIIVQALDRHGGTIFVTTPQPHNGDVRKHAKFIRQFGFHYLCTVPSEGGGEQAAYIRKG